MSHSAPISWVKTSRAAFIATNVVTMCVGVETYGLWQTSVSRLATASTGDASKLALDMPDEAAVASVDVKGDILERPLFIEGRRLGTAQANITPAAPEPPKAVREFKLVAVELTDSWRIAIFSETGTDAVIRLTENDILDGWTLVSVSSDHVELKRANEARELYLADSVPPAPKPVITE